MFVSGLWMRWRNFQNNVRYQNFRTERNVVDVLVGEFRVLIRPVIPRIIFFLSDIESDVRTTAVHALLKLLQQGRVTNFLT